MSPAKTLVILDRDGVINHDSTHYIKSPEECVFIPGSIKAIARLCKAQYTVAIATNQSGIARGFFSQETLDVIHYKIIHAIQQAGGHIDSIAYCPHHPDEGCVCRKPLPLLLQQVASKAGMPLSAAYMIGDSWCDMAAALAAGATPLLVRTGNGCKTLQEHRDDMAFISVFDNLEHAAAWIIEQRIV